MDLNKTVALYSGGVDSYCMAVLTQPDVLLNVNMGGRYGVEETTHLKTPPGLKDRLATVNLPLGQWEIESNKIIPGRNAILAFIASNYGDTILMGSVAKSRGHDKDPEFQERLNWLLDYVFAPQPVWLPEGRNVRLELPVYEYTKTRLVAQAVNHGVPGERVRDDTFSCYTPTNTGEECGECKPCGRKWAALAANGIQPRVDGREAFKPYVDELRNGDPFNRGEQYGREVMAAWNSPF